MLRTSRCDQGGFTPSAWRGTSAPQKPVRGIYFATHFHNFYHDAPTEQVQRYVEDLGLWGYNNVMVWYDMRHFAIDGGQACKGKRTAGNASVARASPALNTGGRAAQPANAARESGPELLLATPHLRL